MKPEKKPVLQVEHLEKYYPISGTRLHRGTEVVHAVDDVSFAIGEGETLGLVGESGCGKSTIGRLLTGIETPTAGSVRYRGTSLASLTPREMAAIRTEIQMVFQDNYSALNPRKRVFDILAEPMRFHHLANKTDMNQKVDALLELVGLPKTAKGRYPHEFSGGQRQRIGIARALSLAPKLLVLDEPVSALDVSVQAQILNLLRDLQAQQGISYLFIGHGLAAVDYIADRVAVMYLGKIMEIGPAETIFRAPLHPYAQALVSSVPLPDPDRRTDAPPLGGEVGSAIHPPQGCRFAPRCPYATDACRTSVPELKPAAGSPRHFVACPVMLAGKEGAK